MGDSYWDGSVVRRFAAFFVLLVVYSVGSAATGAATVGRLGYLDVRSFGAAGDGRTDDTDAFTKALAAASKAGGGVVYAPRGNYLFRGSLNLSLIHI